MKRITLFLALVGITVTSVLAGRIVLKGLIANEAGLTYSTVYTIDTAQFNAPGAIDKLSAQLVISSVNYTALTLTDGRASTGTLTVNGSTLTAGRAASDFLTVKSTNGLSTAYITFNGNVLYQGGCWTAMNTASNTAISIMNCLNLQFGDLITASTGGVNVSTMVFATSTVRAYGANSYSLSSSTPAAIAVASSTFFNGLNPAQVGVQGNWVTYGIDWSTATTSSGTARNISDAFMANTAIAALIRSTWTSAGVVTATSIAQGLAVNYSLRSTDQLDISTRSAGYMTGGSSTSVNTTIGGFSVSSHGFTNGLAVLFSTTSTNVPPGVLTNGVTYYVQLIDANNFLLATTLARATTTIPIPINISSQNAVGGDTFTLTPLALTGLPSARWEFSNDNVNWIPVNTSSITTALSLSTMTAWDFSDVNYHYYRFNVTAPTTGGLYIQLTVNGKSIN